MADPENSDSQQLRLFHECGQGFEAKNPVLIAKTLHEDFRYALYPRSLGKPEQTEEEWLGHWVGIMSLWTVNPKVSYVDCFSDSLRRDQVPSTADLSFHYGHSGKSHCSRSYLKRPYPPHLLT
jgi:hypothetical protein